MVLCRDASCFQFKDDATCFDKIFPCGKAPRFWSVNWTAAVLHLINALLMLFLWSGSDNKDSTYRLTETYAPWIPTVNQTCTPPAIKISDEWCLTRKTKVTEELSLWWLIIGFHGLSFVFQSMAMVTCPAMRKMDYIDEVTMAGTNSLRMIEYSISATLMQVAIALLLGVWQALVILGISFLTAITMLLGLIAEKLRRRNIGLAWLAHIIGWFSMFGVWLILGRQFIFTIIESPNRPPAFVYAIVIVIGLLYSVFGFIQFYQLYKTDRIPEERLNIRVEMMYCVNSLVSKTFLGWMIFSNALVGVAQS